MKLPVSESGTQQNKRILFYSPSGSHRLRFASLVTSRSSSNGRLNQKRHQDFRYLHSVETAADDTNDFDHSMSFGDAKSVFELQITVKEHELHFIGIDEGERAVFRNELQLVDNPRFNDPESKLTFWFPSELLINDDTHRTLRLGIRRPTLELLHVTAQNDQKKQTVCVWLESDAAPCVSAINSFSRGREIANLFKKQSFSKALGNESLFQDDNGGLVRLFRSGIFSW